MVSTGIKRGPRVGIVTHHYQTQDQNPDESSYRLLMPGSNAQAITTMKHSSFEENVQEDFLFGYIVRLAESLNP
jgi:hypothetical protein